MSYVVYQRLKKILPKRINEDQTAYLQNRFIGFNHSQIQDIIDFSDSYKIDVAINFVDFIKAFDMLEWDSMLNTLKHFGLIIIRLFVGSKLYILIFKLVCQILGGCLYSSRTLDGFDKGIFYLLYYSYYL